MKLLLVLAILFTVSPPVFAMNDSIVDYCFTTKDPRQCITSFLADEQRYLQQRQIDA